jgi:nitroimidazol reductase NimA-like FMN-containing flavoprotein (pyridoxamine 5'-phosphate oxidase superfamily)
MGKSDSVVQNGLEEMEKILKRADVGRVALYDGSTPYIVPMNFLYHDGKVAFHCAWEGKKLEVIAANPCCCFEVDEFVGEVDDHFGARCHLDYDSVLAFGKAMIENDAGEKARLLQLFAEKYSEDYRRPVSEGGKRFDESRVSECCCVVVDVKELTGRRERTVEGKRQKIMWRHQF